MRVQYVKAPELISGLCGDGSMAYDCTYNWFHRIELNGTYLMEKYNVTSSQFPTAVPMPYLLHPQHSLG